MSQEALQGTISLEEPATTRSLARRGWASWRPDVLAAIAVFLATRILFLILTYVGYVQFWITKDFSRVPAPSPFWQSWNRWDVGWYTTIAAHGYTTLQTAGFFPLYPLLLHLTRFIVGGQTYLRAGMVVSNAAFFVALVLLHQLVRRDFDQGTARRTLLYLAIFPTAFFFFAAYTESLFLCFAVASFSALRSGRWWVAALCGALAAATRAVGLALLLAWAWEYARQHDWQWRSLICWDVLSALLIPLPVALFALYLWQRFGTPFAYASAEHTYWTLHTTLPWNTLLDTARAIPKEVPYSYSQLRLILDLAPALLALLLIVVGWRRLPVSYSLLALCLVLIPLTEPLYYGGNTPLLISMPRYVLVAFPIFVVLALYAHRQWLHELIVVVFLPLLGIFTTLFLLGRWVA